MCFPVIASTRSRSSSMYCRFTEVMTEIPASRSTSTSCQRFVAYRTGRVIVGESIHQTHFGGSPQNGVDIHYRNAAFRLQWDDIQSRDDRSKS